MNLIEFAMANKKYFFSFTNELVTNAPFSTVGC